VPPLFHNGPLHHRKSQSCPSQYIRQCNHPRMPITRSHPLSALFRIYKTDLLSLATVAVYFPPGPPMHIKCPLGKSQRALGGKPLLHVAGAMSSIRKSFSTGSGGKYLKAHQKMTSFSPRAKIFDVLAYSFHDRLAHSKCIWRPLA